MLKSPPKDLLRVPNVLDVVVGEATSESLVDLMADICMLDMTEDWLQAVLSRPDVQAKALDAGFWLLLEELPYVRAALRKVGVGMRFSTQVHQPGTFYYQATTGSRKLRTFYKLKGRKTI